MKRVLIVLSVNGDDVIHIFFVEELSESWRLCVKITVFIKKKLNAKAQRFAKVRNEYVDPLSDILKSKTFCF